MHVHLRTDSVSHPTESLKMSSIFQNYLIENNLKCCLSESGGCRGFYGKDKIRCRGCKPRATLEDPSMPITNRVVNQEAQQQAAAFLQGIEVPDSYYADLVESVFLLPHQTQQFIPRPLIHLWTRTFTEILRMVNHDPQNMRSLAKCALPNTPIEKRS